MSDPSELAHNHMTRVIEARGVCPKCDMWRDGFGAGGDLAYMNQITDENARLTVEFNQLNERFRAHRDISKLEMEELWAKLGELRAALKVVHSLTRPGLAETFLRDAMADVHEYISIALDIEQLP